MGPSSPAPVLPPVSPPVSPPVVPPVSPPVVPPVVPPVSPPVVPPVLSPVPLPSPPATPPSFVAVADASILRVVATCFIAQSLHRPLASTDSTSFLQTLHVIFAAVSRASPPFPSYASAGTAASSMARANIMANNLFFIKSPPSLFALPASFLRILYPFAYEYTKANL